MPNQIELSIIILCYRSEEAIVEFADRTRKLAEELTNNFEIILVANYFEDSGDRTGDIVKGIAEQNSRYRVVCKPKKGMMGWDMKEGLDSATGKYLCVIDGDGQFPIESIAHCFREIKTGKYGLVKTYRSKRNDGFYRKLISGVYNILFSILFPGIGSKDANSKPKMISRKAYEQMDLHSDDWFIDAEIMINVRRLKINFLEFPVEFEELKGRASFVKFGAIFEFILNLIRYRFNESGSSKNE
jgi:glycosyltransferase involved in cell wall biosynthesis